MMPLHLVFHPDDHPAQLKKVGNWVITFPARRENSETLQLIIRSVIPQQMNQNMQLLNLEIHQSTLDHHWEISTLSYFDGEQAIELHPDIENPIAIKMLKELIQEFGKYDVELQLK